MGWFVLAKLFSVLISLVHLSRLSDPEKDLEILLLRQQISILLRNHDQPVYATRFEKLTLAVIAARVKELPVMATSVIRPVFWKKINLNGHLNRVSCLFYRHRCGGYFCHP